MKSPRERARRSGNGAARYSSAVERSTVTRRAGGAGTFPIALDRADDHRHPWSSASLRSPLCSAELHGVGR